MRPSLRIALCLPSALTFVHPSPYQNPSQNTSHTGHVETLPSGKSCVVTKGWATLMIKPCKTFWRGTRGLLWKTYRIGTALAEACSIFTLSEKFADTWKSPGVCRDNILSKIYMASTKEIVIMPALQPRKDEHSLFLEAPWPLQTHMLFVSCPPSMWSLALCRVCTWGSCWLMKSWLRLHVWPDWDWALRSPKLLRCSRGVGGCGEKQPLVPRSFLSLSLELLIHIRQIVFSEGCGVMEIKWFLNAAYSVEFAELF